MTWIQSVFSSVFPGPQMPWSKNSSLQLQDMYNQVYSHLICTSKHRDVILRILGQVIVAQGMASNEDAFDLRINLSSPQWIAAILGLEHGSLMQIVTKMHLLFEAGNEYIRIRHPPFIEFLLDRTRSRKLFVDVDEARLLRQNAPAIVRWIFNTHGTRM